MAQAGTAEEPDIVDPAGDVQYEDPVPPPHPCVDAVDLLSLWVEWTTGGAVFHYKFADLSPVQDQPAQDFTGRCFYSYTDFVLTRADGSKLVDSLYVDHWANPMYVTGWRFYLHESREPAIGTVDIATGTIDVLVPAAALGNPGPGDALGSFRVQSTTQIVATPVVSDFATDMSPNDGPCDCPVPFPTAAAPASANSPAPSPTPTAESGQPSASSSASSSASTSSTTSAAQAVRPPDGLEEAASSGEATEPGAAAKESPMPLWATLAVFLAALAVRRRLA